MAKVDSFTLAERILGILKCRAAWDGGRAAMSLGEIATTLFGRFPTDGEPTKSQVKAGLNCLGLGGRVRMIDGKVVYRQSKG